MGCVYLDAPFRALFWASQGLATSMTGSVFSAPENSVDYPKDQDERQAQGAAGGDFRDQEEQ